MLLLPIINAFFIFMQLRAVVKGEMLVCVVRHRHTYHPQVYTSGEGEDGKRHEDKALGRVEAARRIRAVLSKLGQEWLRKPYILAGWKDSL
jgi:hypothetical protein